MRLIKTLITCAAIGTIATLPAAAQSAGAAKPNAMQADKQSKMMPDSGDKHAMSKKSGMSDSAGTSKTAMKGDKSKAMMKPKAAKDSGMAKDSAMGMMKKPKA